MWFRSFIAVLCFACSAISQTNNCSPYFISIPDEYLSEIKTKPIHESSIISFIKRDSFQVLTVIPVKENEYGEDTYYELTDGTKSGFISTNMFSTNYDYEKEKCLSDLYTSKMKLKASTKKDKNRQDSLNILDQFPEGFFITSVSPSNPNSAHGVNVTIKNNVARIPKTIKYIKYYVTPFNAVGDSVSCSITGEFLKVLSITGPINNKNSEFSTTWDNVWYNGTISCVQIKQIEIDFIDGTNKFIKKDIKKYLLPSVKNSCKYSE